jgi:hypothetical protein
MCSHTSTVSSNSGFHDAPPRVDQINGNHKQQGQVSMENETLETNVFVIISKVTQYVAQNHAANDTSTEQSTTV